jgi:hypothetical protein
MKEWAKSEGYNMTQRPKDRMSLVKLPCGIAGYRNSSSYQITKVRDDMVDAGEIDIGVPITPITSSNSRTDKQGNMNQIKKEHFGRKLSLLNIRKQHLEKMHEIGALRHTDTSKLHDNELRQLLHNYSGKFGSRFNHPNILT